MTEIKPTAIVAALNIHAVQYPSVGLVIILLTLSDINRFGLFHKSDLMATGTFMRPQWLTQT